MILLLALGCPKGSREARPVEEAAPIPEAPVRSPITGPRYWSEPGGLCLEIPEGWSGTAGPPPLVLELTQAETGFGLELHATDPALPLPPREGYELLFEDPGSYRTVPILGSAAGTRSWISTDPDGPMAQSFYAPVGGRLVEVVMLYPHGRAIEGEEVLSPLLHAICTTWR